MKAASDSERTQKLSTIPSLKPAGGSGKDSGKIARSLLQDIDNVITEVEKNNPRIAAPAASDSTVRVDDLQALLQVSLAINSSLVLDDILRIVMAKAVELMQAERGLIMLLDETGELQIKSAYNLCKEEMMEEDFRISGTITHKVAETGRSVYTSDALADDRFAKQQSIVELHLRSIMCVPITLKEQVIGVIYLDNSSQSKMFLKSDLYLFELYAQLVANALHNAQVYDSLLKMKKYNESVVTTTPVGIVVIDTRGRLATINPVALEIFDLNRDTIHVLGGEAIPTVFIDVLPRAQQARWQSMINTVLTTGQELADPRFFHNTNYVEKVLSIKITPTASLPNGDRGLAMAIEDITEKVLMEKYVILSEKLVARGEMAASVAHELNNYLSIISNNAELLQVNIDRERYEKVKFNGKSIVENVFKIKRFVDSLMDFSKPEPEFINYDIKHLIDDLLFSLRIQPRFKLIHFTLNLAAEIPSLEIDVGQIQQVLMNLLNNAADAIEEQALTLGPDGKAFKRQIGLTATYERDIDQVVIEVSDNGAGITDEALGKLFTLHFTTKKHGHGLGLHNCRKIVEHHHGRLDVSSRVREGTVFRMSLPRLQPKPITAGS